MSWHDPRPIDHMELNHHPATTLRTREAVEIQRSLMPPPMYVGGFVHAAATTRPCYAIGGDFYDYLDTGREFHVLVGDACGKGTPAALQAALVQGILAGDVESRAGAADVVAHLNRTLCRRPMGERFVTLFYGVLDREHRFTYCNAGHCRPMLVDGTSVRRLGVGGVPPGLFGEAAYEEESVRVERGDTLVVFSDGLTDAASRDQRFGDARILEIVTEHRDRTASTILERLIASVREFTDGGRARDDMTAVVVRYLG